MMIALRGRRGLEARMIRQDEKIMAMSPKARYVRSLLGNLATTPGLAGLQMFCARLALISESSSPCPTKKRVPCPKRNWYTHTYYVELEHNTVLGYFFLF